MIMTYEMKMINFDDEHIENNRKQQMFLLYGCKKIR
jgi:hypothetical protein